jgi:hypothetical protein
MVSAECIPSKQNLAGPKALRSVVLRALCYLSISRYEVVNSFSRALYRLGVQGKAHLTLTWQLRQSFASLCSFCYRISARVEEKTLEMRTCLKLKYTLQTFKNPDTHKRHKDRWVWWSILTLNLIKSRITWEMDLWVHLLGIAFFMIMTRENPS